MRSAGVGLSGVIAAVCAHFEIDENKLVHATRRQQVTHARVVVITIAKQELSISVCDKLAESIDQSLAKSEALRQSILKEVFEGKLLSRAELGACRREPDWEPVENLLERIKKIRNEKSRSKKGTNRGKEH